jgi:hypothetical protein
MFLDCELRAEGTSELCLHGDVMDGLRTLALPNESKISGHTNRSNIADAF